MFSSLIKSVMAILDAIPGWIWALLVAALLFHSFQQRSEVAGLKTDVQTALRGKADAENALKGRVAAEAVAVAAAVQSAVLEERRLNRIQEEKVNELRKQNELAVRERVDAAGRVRHHIDDAAPPGAGCERGAEAAPSAPGTEDPALTRFREAGRTLSDGLLQILEEADAVTRERNLCITLLPPG